jgi:hypothetical protein
MPAGRACPRTAGARAAPRVGITLGDGPVFPVLGFSAPPPSARGLVSLRENNQIIDGRHVVKVLWAVKPGVAARLTVTGGRLRGSRGDTRLRFQLGDGDPIRPQLHLATSRSLDWAYFPSALLVRRPGCYALEVNTQNSVSTVVFDVA